MTKDAVESKLDTALEVLNRLDRTLHGVDDKPGLVARVFVLEDRSSVIRWHFRTLYTAVLAAVLGVLAYFFKT